MFSYKKIEGTGNAQMLIINSVLLGGIFLRFYFQFIEWSFNGDEVHLGLNIVNNNIKELISPLSYGQSAPPLFLVLQKLFLPITKPYVSLKIISFISSCSALFLFNRLLKKHFPFQLQILLLGLFCFNPFILSNSLTLKQYSLDLSLGLVAVNFFLEKRNGIILFLFYSVFCLLSNIGPFFCVSILIFSFFNLVYKKEKITFSNISKKLGPLLLAPIPYTIFFLWFMNQAGGENLKSFMVNYWSGSFMPIDFSVFKWMAIQVKGLTLFFFSSYFILGFSLFFLFALGLFSFFRDIRQNFDNGILKIAAIYILCGVVHLFLSSLKIYPFSDRLILYLAPGIYCILGYGILQFLVSLKNFKMSKIGYYLNILLILLITGLYFIYLPERKNNVIEILKFMNSTNKTIAFTPKAKRTIAKWLEFTDYKRTGVDKLKFAEIGSDSISFNKDFLIGIQSSKFGHSDKLTTPEPIISQLLEKDKIHFYKRFEGYVIYKFKMKSEVN